EKEEQRKAKGVRDEIQELAQQILEIYIFAGNITNIPEAPMFVDVVNVAKRAIVLNTTQEKKMSKR
ncbi:15929_t:CDS:1, partial [Acaulospora morrowiae]